MTTKVLPELKYTKDHEWIKIDADGFGLMGITDHSWSLVYFKYDEHRSIVLLYRFNPFFIKKR